MLGLNYWYQDSDRDLPRLMNNRAAEHDEKQFDTNHRLQTSFKHYGNMFNWEINSGFAFNKLNYYLKNKPLGSSEMNTNQDSRSKTYTSITQYKALKEWNNQWNFDFQALMAFNYAEFYDEKYLTGYTNNQNEYALFTGLHKSFGTRWKLSALVRQQIIDGSFIKPIPSLGAVYSIFVKNPLSLKANVSRNYHYPTLNQLYFMPGGNPNLLPEEGLTSEFSINSSINTGHIRYKNEVNLYYSVINDWILWKPSQFGYWVPQNTQKVYSRGVEYTGKITREVNGLKTEIALKYAFTPTTNESTNLAAGDASKGHQLIYIPLHNGGYTELVSYRGFDFIWSSFYTGVRNTATVSNQDNIPLSGYWLSNMSLGKKIMFKENHFSMRFTIDNVFNKDYQSIKYRAMPGRNYYVMVNLEF
jgi:iron complex outermembrane receptor protein